MCYLTFLNTVKRFKEKISKFKKSVIICSKTRSNIKNDGERHNET